MVAKNRKSKPNLLQSETKELDKGVTKSFRELWKQHSRLFRKERKDRSWWWESKGIDHKTKVITNKNIKDPWDVSQLCTKQVGTGEMIKYKRELKNKEEKLKQPKEMIIKIL